MIVELIVFCIILGFVFSIIGLAIYSDVRK